MEQIRTCDAAELAAVPKSDLHNHAGRGGSIAYIAGQYGVRIAPPPASFGSLTEMQSWFEENIKSHCAGTAGYLKRLEASFVQANEDNIRLLALSFAKDEIDALGGMEPFRATLRALNDTFAPQTIFQPELAFGREQPEDEILPWLEEVLEYHFFTSVDICGNELAQPIQAFQRIYRVAESHNLRLKAHVGEFGSADDVREAVETLHLHEVHHGIAAAQSARVMRWLSKHAIQLNVCPTSNIMLRRAENYRSHPIKTLFDYGVPVTINTDDMLIFNSSVSQEYKKLFDAGTFTCEELERIRRQGLSA